MLRTDSVVSLNALEKLADQYVICWKPQRPKYEFSIFEDNELGCEHLQIFRNGYQIEALRHAELSRLATLLMRTLAGQINADHKLFWAWCAFLSSHFSSKVTLFRDADWQDSFRALTDLVLAKHRRAPPGPNRGNFYQGALRFVNRHLLRSADDTHVTAAPLAFAVLEGILRRKCSTYLDADGTVKKQFSISYGTGTRRFSKGRLNQLNDALRLFEQTVTKDRGRSCPELAPLLREAEVLYATTRDAREMIAEWRNEFMHGKEYWQNRVPVILNVIALLVIDE